MTEGERVAGGDRIGKTIIFAKNQAHAAERFDANYPKFKGAFALAIHHGVSAAVVDRRLLEYDQHRTSLSLSTCSIPRSMSGCRQSRSSRTGHYQDEVLADGGAWHQTPSEPLRPGNDKSFFILDYCGDLDPWTRQRPRVASVRPSAPNSSRPAWTSWLQPEPGIGSRRRTRPASSIRDGVTPAAGWWRPSDLTTSSCARSESTSSGSPSQRRGLSYTKTTSTSLPRRSPRFPPDVEQRRRPSASTS